MHAPVPVRRTPSFAETVKAVWWWVTGHHALSLREQIRDAKLVERLAAEIAEEETPQPPAPRQPKRQSIPQSERVALRSWKA
jgi:hypothetical protein